MPKFLLCLAMLVCCGCVTSGQLREAEERCRSAIESGDTEAANQAAEDIKKLAEDQEQVESAVKELARTAEGLIPGVPAGLSESLIALALAYGTYRTTRTKVNEERNAKYIEAAKAVAIKGDQAPAA